MNLRHAATMVFISAAALFIDPITAPTPRQRSSSETGSALKLTVSLSDAEPRQSKSPTFRVELRNSGESDVIVNLGIMLANGKKQYPKDIVLILIDSQGKSRRLDLKEPAIIAGRMDPMIVPLPAGSSFSLPINLDNYWAAASQDFDYRPQSGTYSLEAQFSGRAVTQQEANLDVKGIALMPYWTGTITSNRVQFKIPSP